MKQINTKISESGFGASQDISTYLDIAHDMRATVQENTTFRSFCIIPDIVAIDLNLKHKIDVHSTEFEHDAAQHKKMQQIIRQEYPYLLTGGITNRFTLGSS